MIRSLLRKELSEHGAAFALLAALSAAMLAATVQLEWLDAGGGSALPASSRFLHFLALIACPLVCGRLVVREYRGRTQLFLEGLPVSRARLLAVKYALGLASVLALAACGLAVAVALSWRGEVITGRYLAILASRAGAGLLCWYAIFFAASFLGRYRAITFAGWLLGWLLLESVTDIDLSRFGPIELMGGRFASERVELPVEALGEALALAACFSALAFVLGGLREGSVAALLAEKMSLRERVFAFCSALVLLSLFGIYEERRSKPPYELVGGVAVARERARVEVLPAADAASGEGAAAAARRRAERLAQAVAGELDALAAYLGLARFPSVFVTPRRDLDVTRFERAELAAQDGLLVRANFAGEGFESGAFVEWLAREVLIEHSRGRAQREPRAWILDGLPHFFARRAERRAAGGGELAADRRYALRALYGAQRSLEAFPNVSAEPLARWLRVRDALGAPVAAGVAWSGLHALERRFGEPAARAFLRAVFAGPDHDDVRALFDHSRVAWQQLLAVHGGVDAGAFFEAWTDALRGAHDALAGPLERVPRLAGEARFEPLSSETRQLRFELAVEPTPPPEQRVALLTAPLSWFDVAIPPDAIVRLEFQYGEAEGTAPGTFARGQRVARAFALYSDPLGCELISGWWRGVVP